jgi:hypothetical protein
MRTAAVTAALVTALVGAACGGGGEDPSQTPASTTASVSVAPAGAQAAVGTFRACHRHSDDSLVLVLLFENRDRSLIGNFEGPVGFEVAPAEPATWTSTGQAVVVAPGFHPNLRRITVPPGQVAPAEITLSVSTTPADDPGTVLATNDVTILVPSTSCSAA